MGTTTRMRARHAVLALGLLAITACGGGGGGDPVAKGDRLFHGEATCQVCHGADLRGTPMGPPFLNEVYAPARLPDEAFHDAVRNGVRPHNWSFGPMPPLPHVTDAQVDAIVAYVRSEQRKAGIR